MKIPISRKIVEKIYGREIDLALVKFYFDPFVDTGYVRKVGLGYEIVLGRNGLNANTIAHELAHIQLGHLESKDELYQLGLSPFYVNIIQDIEVELYIRKESFNSAPQFTDEELISAYNKVERWL